ncbi:MAG: CHAT domain-containing tetratricopeptide repeat protein, partial [Acidobacteriota bacterium]|nr:CHAT domain-containing tetratricopeptide repeat protein [Acidobacteriota bacterium]
MTRNELALSLANTAEEVEREKLIRRNAPLADAELARFLKDICLDSWTSNPTRAVRAAQSLAFVSKINPQPEIIALAAWTDGLAQMINGQLRHAVACFDEAQEKFQNLNQNHTAASTQVGKLYPLAMLGRYDEAIECGLKAREIFLECSDYAAAGRIEHNLGNIYQRSDRYEEAESFLRQARDRFVFLKDAKQLAQITNSLAYVLSNRYQFRESEAFYEEALQLAGQAELTVTKAEIESNLGYFSLFQGRYDRALEFLERARTSYAELGMPHQSAIAELEMADAYLELNLFTEAAALYSRIIPLFAEIGMPIEHARTLANFARVQFVLGEAAKSYSLLRAARRIFASCRSEVGEATVLLNEAQFLFAENKFEDAIKILGLTEMPLAQAGIKGAQLLADFLRAESWRALGNLSDAQKLLKGTLLEAETNEIPPLAARCLTALGLLANAADDSKSAEDYFKRAVSVIENLRAPLPSEDLRTAFFGDKLTPYNELVKICLTDENRVVEAFENVEKSRSRALHEMMQRSGRRTDFQTDNNENNGVSDLNRQIADLREELNWLYNQINQPTGNNTSRNLTATLKLHEAARTRENAVGELTRQKNLRQPEKFNAGSEPFNLTNLQKNLGDDTVLIEYAEIDGEFSAFVVTDAAVRVFPHLCRADEIAKLLSRLHFQLDSLRNNPRLIESHFYELTLRTRRVLSELYDLLLRPLESAIGLRRLVVAPHRALHYVPFHALYDGFGYAIENREIAYAPGAGILQNCFGKPRRPFESALFVGVSDDRIPFVGEETKTLARLFPNSVTLLDASANYGELTKNTSDIDVLHLACHGQFRAENPLFSSLKLFDRWLTVRDVDSLKLNADLVVLSACETGVSRIAPGDELLGLVRGFFSAGASSLVLSLWNVHDQTTV